MIVYNHMQAWIYALPDLSGNAKLLLQRMVSLSKDGEQPVFVKREDFARQLGFAAKTVSRAFIELTAKDFIEEIKNPNKWDRVKHFRITSKTLQDFSENADLTDLDKMSTSKETKCPDRYGQNDQIDMDKKSKDSGQNVPLDLDKMSTSSSDRSLGRTKEEAVVENAREKNDNSNSAPALNDVPLPDDSDFYETEENTESEPDLNDLYGTECTYNAQEVINPPKTTNYTSNTSNTLSAQSSNEIEGVKRQLTIPTSPEEVIPLIEKFKNAHKAEKVYEKIDVFFYAGKIFDYYAGSDGIWRDNRGNEIPPYRIFQKISTWIVNDQRAGKLQTILEGGPLSVEKLNGYFDEIDQKKKAEREAKMRQFGIKPPPVNATFEVLEGDEQNEQKLLEAK